MPPSYSEQFYRDHSAGSSRSAEVVLRLVHDLYPFDSVLDVGCGAGTWLGAAEKLGVTSLVGLDGPWVNAESFRGSRILFSPVDFESGFPALGRFGLAMSVEVAEHLPERLASALVRTLCNASDVVLFGAASKFQGGTNHVNEQSPSYWHSLFAKAGFEFFDCIRPAIWELNDVEWWYRQNTFLFVNRDFPGFDRGKATAMQKPIVNAVHPGNLEAKVREHAELSTRFWNPDARFWIGALRRWLLGRLRG